MNLNQFETITNALVEDGYIVLENALSQDLTQELFLLAQDESNYKSAGISASSHFHIDTTKRSDKTLWLDEDNASQSKYLTFTKNLQEYLNYSLFLGLSYYEAHFAIYNAGDFYEKHLDAFKGSKNRVVTTVFYLNEEWSEKDGGELIIYDEQDNIITKVLPKSNTLVVFLSDKFPHEVLKSNKKRYSIAGWFRVDK